MNQAFTLNEEELRAVVSDWIAEQTGISTHDLDVSLSVTHFTVGSGMQESIEHRVSAVATRRTK